MIKLQCECGKRIAISGDFPSERGRCPRCGKVFDVPGQSGAGAAAPSRVQPARGLSGALATATLLVSGIAIVGLVLAFRARGEVRDLERRLHALGERTESAKPATQPASPAANTDPAPRSAALRSDPEMTRKLEQFRNQLETLGMEMKRVGRLAERAASRPEAPVRTGPVPSRPITGLEERLVAVAKRCSPPVVAIVTDRGAGSGVVISSDGLILTNEHVISGRRSIEAQFPSGEKRVARILGRDAMSDIALLQVQATGLPAMAMGDSDQVQVGQVVAALGNPFGLSRDGKPAMTVGIISALHRIVAPGNGKRRYGDAIQTDAAINPGNSGGALVDLDGKLIGINGAISSKTGTSSGVGFAIPINFVKRILPDLKEGRSPRPGFLGITVRDLTAEEATRTRHRGAVVTSVQPGSPAQRARFRTGQLITRFEGRVVSSSTDLINRISYYQAGALVRVRLLQSDGTERDVSVRIGSR